MEDIARNYVTFARQLASNGCYSKAFDLYILAFEKCSIAKAMFEPEFRVVLMRLNELLMSSSRMEDIFSNFGRALGAFPGNIHLLNDIGKYLFKYGFNREAWNHFAMALKTDSGFVDAEKNMNSVKNFLVERWHFRMLNDWVRNNSYQQAINEVVRPHKDTVLDLGSGTGLLAMYAYECSPIAVTAVDASSCMTKLSEDIMDDRSLNYIVVINKISTDLNYKDIGGKRSILVTELFDAGLFGEHILKSLAHAWENLLNVDARVIPSKAEFFIVGAKCDSLHMKYQLTKSALDLLNLAEVNVHSLTYEETYDCEDIPLYKDVIYITEPQSLVKIDFNCIADIKDKLNREEPYEVQLTAKVNDEINVMIGWFNIYLTDTITITTNPASENRCNAWQQAIFYDHIPQTVKENETLNFKFLCNDERFSLIPDPAVNIEKISNDTIRFLNDSEYMNKISGIIGMASVYLGQIAGMSQTNIVDLCPFPVFGLMMLKRGVQSLVCTAKTENDKKFLIDVLEANNIPLSKLEVYVGEDWSKDTIAGKYHAIFCNIMEVCGDLDLKQKETAEYLKNYHLLQGGLFLPSQISLMAQIVYSGWLEINNCISDDNVGIRKMAKHVNIYQVSQNFSIDFHNLKYTALTEPHCLGAYTNNMRSEVINIPVINDGDANAILCWYNIELMKDMGEISTNRKGSFIDGIAFIANPHVSMVAGQMASILRCVDPEGGFKLVLDIEETNY